jgi:hypothetical protein
VANGRRVAFQGAVSIASAAYRPRRPEQGELHQLMRDHFETFRAQAAAMRDGQGLPRFVEEEFRLSPRSRTRQGVANCPPCYSGDLRSHPQ